jgi:predicted enzyme related to lactoylglutathione lyase
MPAIDRQPVGAFSWIELATSDQVGAKNFYGSLFGWTAEDSPMGPGETYTTFRLNGGAAAAAYTMRREQRAQGVPPNWMIYVTVESADQAAKRAGELAGSVCAPAFDVMDYGRMAVLQDPTGATFSVWQAKTHAGITVTGEPGTLCWADLSTPDVEKAKRFYEGLFHWNIHAGEKDSSGYLHIKNGEHYIGGIPPASHRQPGAPPHWLAYFLVSDCDATAAKAHSMGAKLFLPPTTFEKVGRMSVISDPQGAVFAIFQAIH